MARKILLTGTGTGIGKSYLSLALCQRAQREGVLGAYFKPFQCGTYPVDGTEGGDADWIKFKMPHFAVETGYQFKQACSPHLASEKEGVEILPEKIIAQLKTMEQKYEWILVEGAGGIQVPLNRQGYHIGELSLRLGASVIVAALPGLGTLNHTLLTLSFLKYQGIRTEGFFFVQTTQELDPLYKDNSKTIEELSGVDYFGLLPFAKEKEADLEFWTTTRFEKWWG